MVSLLRIIWCLYSKSPRQHPVLDSCLAFSTLTSLSLYKIVMVTRKPTNVNRFEIQMVIIKTGPHTLSMGQY